MTASRVRSIRVGGWRVNRPIPRPRCIRTRHRISPGDNSDAYLRNSRSPQSFSSPRRYGVGYPSPSPTATPRGPAFSTGPRGCFLRSGCAAAIGLSPPFLRQRQGAATFLAPTAWWSADASELGRTTLGCWKSARRSGLSRRRRQECGRSLCAPRYITTRSLPTSSLRCY